MIRSQGFVVDCCVEGCSVTIRDRAFPYLTRIFTTRAEALDACREQGWETRIFTDLCYCPKHKMGGEGTEEWMTRE